MLKPRLQFMHARRLPRLQPQRLGHTHLLAEFRQSLPAAVQLHAELVALDHTGRPDFHRLSSRPLPSEPRAG
jgi:hypothetical protein